MLDVCFADSLTEEVVIASFEALDAIHSSGILHKDLHANNILVPKGCQSGVRIIDFGTAHPISDYEDCKNELVELQRIFCEMMEGSITGTIC
jgi:serine/threonine protein kinase